LSATEALALDKTLAQLHEQRRSIPKGRVTVHGKKANEDALNAKLASKIKLSTFTNSVGFPGVVVSLFSCGELVY